MSNIKAPVAVGLLTIIAMVLLGYLIFKTSESPITGGEGIRVYAIFPSAKGLVKKSQVTVSGIPVGQIENISLDGTKAKVWIRLRPDLKIYENARASKVQESLLGTALIEIYPGTPDYPEIKDGGQIKNVSDFVSMEQIFDKFGSISDDVKAITSSLRSTMTNTSQGEKPALEQILTNLAELTNNLNKMVAAYSDKADKIVNDASMITGRTNRLTRNLEGDLSEIIRNIKDITVYINDMLHSKDNIINKSSATLSDVSERMNKLLDRLDSIAANLESVTNDIKQGKGTVGQLLKDDKIGKDITYITSRAREFVRKIDELQLQFHLESDYYPTHNTGKAYVYLRLRPNKYKYYLFGVVSDPWGSITRTTTQTSRNLYDNNGKLINSATETESNVSTEYKLKITMLYARTFWLHDWFAPTFYFGLIENTGGVGMDLHMFDDYWRIESQFYDFKLEEYPNWKVQTSISFLEHRLFITAGLDRILDSAFKYWFVGGGLEFSDDDLKILFTVGSPSISQ